MSNCDPHSQVMTPCTDDAVSVAQVLGTRGDISFDENGVTNLLEGATDLEVPFLYEKESADYRFEYLYVTEEGAVNPSDIRAAVKLKATTKFGVSFSGQPPNADCKLYWRVVVPDSLHICQGLTAQPQFAIVRPPQQGVTPLVVDQDYIEVAFASDMTDNDWVFEALSIEYDGAVSPAILSWTVTEHTVSGFKLVLSGSPPGVGYSLRWKVA